MTAAVGEAAAIGLVVLTHDRRAEVLATLGRLRANAPGVPVCVVVNGSADGTAPAVRRAFPEVDVVALARNLGAAGRNHGARRMRARYLAFCDDDTWWEAGALERAVEVLDAYPALAAVTARVLVGHAGREDPTSTLMGACALPNPLGHPGAAACGFLAGACVMRRSAFLAGGGYEPRFFIGGEEALLGLDLLAAGWRLGYLPELVVHHHPSARRDHAGRRRLLLRNALWCAWLRRPRASAWRLTTRALAAALAEPPLWPALAAAVGGLPWALRRRRVVPAGVEAMLREVEAKSA